MIICCPRVDELCERCRSALFEQLRGVAACRGILWAERVHARCPDARPWPPFEGRCADLVRRKVQDLARDQTLRELLAEVVAREAARWWTEHHRAAAAPRR
jgi:hypothetical protein